MTVPYTFATQRGPLPLSQLDANFADLQNNLLAEAVNLDWYSFLATGDDYTTALAAAVATGKPVYVPWRATTRTITAGVTLADGQVIFGDGQKSRLKFAPATNLGVLFNVNNKVGAGARNLWIEGPGVTVNVASSYTQSGVCGIGASTADCIVEGCTFSGWAGGSVFFQDSTGTMVMRNRFHTAMCMPLASDNFGAADITFWGSSVDCRAEGNVSDSGAAYGIIVQTIAGTPQTALRNKVRGNVITGAKNYAILCYNQSSGIPPISNQIYETDISGNTIKDVYGFYNNPATGLKDYGAGIYVLSSERTLLANNIVENTCINTAGSTLTPAGISYNASSTGTIIGNKIKTSTQYGIFVTDGLQLGEGVSPTSVNFVPSGYTIISGNTVEDSAKHGILIRDHHKVKCQGNTVNGVTAVSNYGISVEVSATAVYPILKWISVDGNSINASANGIFVKATGASVSSNQIEGGSTGIFADTVDSTINSNTILNVTTGAGRGIDLRSTGSNSAMSGNIIAGCALGARAEHRVKWGENDIRSNTTDWSGAYAYKVTAAPTQTFSALRGDRVIQLTAATGSPKAWVCTGAPPTGVTGSITSGTNTLTLSTVSSFTNGAGIRVIGAGASGADLVTTITSGGGSLNLVLAANAGFTVAGAATTHAGIWASEGNL